MDDVPHGILLCSGFAYGDTWTTPRLIQRCDYYGKLKKRGAPIVVLPQAMGPFKRPDIRAAAQRLFNLCDLVYARDDDSYRHLSELELGDQASIEQAPDVTHLLAEGCLTTHTNGASVYASCPTCK